LGLDHCDKVFSIVVGLRDFIDTAHHRRCIRIRRL
jgi:hypothetical protein